MKIANDMKDKIDDMKKKVEELEHNLSSNFVSKEIYTLEIKGINRKIEEMEEDIDQLNLLPDKVKGNSKYIEDQENAKSKIAWTVFSLVIGAFVAFVLRGGLA